MYLRLLSELEAAGVKFSIRDGKLYGSKGMTPQQRETVKANKVGLLAVVTHQCPTCNQPLRTFDYISHKALQCPTSPLHFYEEMFKPGHTVKLYDGDVTRLCLDCGTETKHRFCDACWLKAIELSEQEQGQ